MALYVYQAFTRDGQKQTGSLDAPSEGAARELLQRKGLLPYSILPAHKAAQSENFLEKIFASSITLKEKILFTKQFAVLLRSGIPLVPAVELLIEQFDGRMHRILVSIKDGLKEGQSLADGMRNYPNDFENFYVQLIRAGEASGKLEVILDRLNQYLERTEELNNKIVEAVRMPLIQLFAILLITLGLMVGLVPQLVGIFKSQGGNLPIPTVILMAMSDAILNHYLTMGIVITILVLIFLYWKSTKEGALAFDRIKLKTPIVQNFTKTGAIVQFCKTLGMLLEGGVNLSEALDIVCNIVDNMVLKESLKEAREKIIKQGKIAQYLKQTGIFPSMATYLISTGEETGKLDAMLISVGDTYEKELTEYADTLTSLLSPIMTAVTALIVIFIVMGVMLPIMNMSNLVH